MGIVIKDVLDVPLSQPFLLRRPPESGDLFVEEI
jgi:hypothetical protein